MTDLSFFNHCHPSLPVIADRISASDMQRTSSYLLTVVIAVASRFWLRSTYPSQPPSGWDVRIPSASAHLAYSHLAATLFRKQHRLADVQATLLLAGWGLQGGGQGPDPWLVTGHCVRLARRMGLHRTPYDVVPESLEGKRRLRDRWRVWLCWYQ